MSKFKIPNTICKEAKDYMKDVITNLTNSGIIEDVDTAALNMLARNYNTFIEASNMLEQEGLTVKSDRGNISEHPLVKIAKDAQSQAMKVMLEFGLTAKSRTKLLKQEGDNDEPSLLENFMKNR